MITVIDYGMGNLRSVTKALELYTDSVSIENDPSSISRSDALVLPGDGAFAKAMEHLKDGGWVEPLKEWIAADKPFLGICLGFQLLFSESEEYGTTDGLDIIQGRVERFDTPGLKVPHMGWNNVALSGSHAALDGIENNSYFYFIHSYYPVVEDNSWILGTAEYGEPFTCIVGKGNVLATQFHPEKSHTVGLKIVENFVRSIC